MCASVKVGPGTVELCSVLLSPVYPNRATRTGHFFSPLPLIRDPPRSLFFWRVAGKGTGREIRGGL